jgi:hypothetical protein
VLRLRLGHPDDVQLWAEGEVGSVDVGRAVGSDRGDRAEGRGVEEALRCLRHPRAGHRPFRLLDRHQFSRSDHRESAHVSVALAADAPRIWLVFAASGADAFASGCHWLRPLGSIKAPYSVGMRMTADAPRAPESP